MSIPARSSLSSVWQAGIVPAFLLKLLVAVSSPGVVSTFVGVLWCGYGEVYLSCPHCPLIFSGRPDVARELVCGGNWSIFPVLLPSVAVVTAPWLGEALTLVW